MDHFEKFLRQLDAKLRARVLAAAAKIAAGTMEGLDVKKLRGNGTLYRCRIGNVRIIFAKSANGRFFILDAHFRGSVYKK